MLRFGTGIVMANLVMGHIVTAHRVTAHIVIAHKAMARNVMACIVMAHIVMAHIVMVHIHRASLFVGHCLSLPPHRHSRRAATIAGTGRSAGGFALSAVRVLRITIQATTI